MNRLREIYPADPDLDERAYVRRILESYRRTPTTIARSRPADRQLAASLYRDGVPARLVEDAFVFAAIRRLFRPWNAEPLTLVRSMHYFVPVIDELRRSLPDPGYFVCQRWKLRNLDVYNARLVDNLRLEPIHTRDEDCHLDRFDCCVVCHKRHWTTCPDCGRRGYHHVRCPWTEDLFPRPVS